jgi:predicted DCC family thiol-disulfide oxidoreductase YuxK
MIVLFDGRCRLCARSARALQRRFGPARLELEDLQQPGVLERHPSVTREAAMRRMHLVLPDGRVFGGAEAFARLLSTVRGVGWLAYLYYLPGVRQLADLAYALVARYRYRLFGRAEACDGGTCHLHGA